MAHSKIIYIISILTFSLFLIACQRDEIDYSQMVVEGWIDAGKHPIVMLHTSYSLGTSFADEGLQLKDVLQEHLVLFGKIVLFDGEDSVTLTGRVDTNYIPPYIYTTTKIRGEIGKTYTLHASYQGRSARSETYIPTIATFDSIRATENRNNKISIVGYANNLIEGDTYIIMARTFEQQQYKICPMGAFRATHNKMAITINNPINFTGDGMMLQTLFPKTDSTSISIKFAKVGELEYQMWDSYIAQNTTQGLFFMQTYSNIMSNIQGGNGYWCGMGASEYIISLKGDSLYTFF